MYVEKMILKKMGSVVMTGSFFFTRGICILYCEKNKEVCAMDFKSLIKNLFTLGGEDRKFIKEVDEFIEESEKKISEIEAKDEILRELMK